MNFEALICLFVFKDHFDIELKQWHIMVRLSCSNGDFGLSLAVQQISPKPSGLKQSQPFRLSQGFCESRVQERPC